MKKVAVFASGRGSNFENIVVSNIEGITVSLLVTDKTCNALSIAQQYKIEARTFLAKSYPTKQAMEEDIAALLVSKKIDLIVLAGYMRLFSPWFVHQFPKRIINIHPSLLPNYKGKGAIEQAINDRKRIYGVTVHYVNEGMDEGEIISQVKVPYEGYDLQELEKRVHECEYQLYPKVIAQLCKEERGMNVAVIGNGGREHALAKKCLQSPHVTNVFVIPGNSGMLMSDNLQIFPDWDGSFDSLETYLQQQDIQLIIVGNEAYLEKGITDYFSPKGYRVFGPSKEGATLESSKDFAKHFMKKYQIPTADFTTLTTFDEAERFINESSKTLVIKQDGLALGKGVLVTDDKDEARQFVQESFNVTKKVVFEEYLEGKEFSLLAFVNNDYYNCMIPARDYKRAYDGDRGLNTGGMGAYAPVEYLSDEDMVRVHDEIIAPTIKGLSSEHIDFTGILYFGLMKTKEGIKVIEYNTRFGDPETEVLLESMESDLIETITATFKKEEYPLRWKKGITLGVCLASKGYPSSYEKGSKVELAKNKNCYSMALHKENDSYLTNGGRVLFVVEHGQTLEEVRGKCYKSVSSIKSDGLFYRTDIGL